MRNHIRARRTHAALSQSHLATQMGVSRQTINSLENGRYLPSLRGGEVALDQVRLSSHADVRARGPHSPGPGDSVNARAAHQPGDLVAADVVAARLAAFQMF